MFDALRNQYKLRCALTGESVWISISKFRAVKRLRGASVPAVFRVQYNCSCNCDHEALITHDTLDYQPLATEATTPFVNLLTGSRELLATELAEVSSSKIRRGNWPWTFYCFAESTHRPGFPSSLRMVSPLTHEHGDNEHLGVLVRCSSCERMTINLVTRQHLDVPFFNDEKIHFVDRLVGGDSLSVEETFRHQLDAARFRTAS